MVKTALMIVVIVLNILGSDLIGTIAEIATLVVMFPFVILIVFAAPSFKPSALLSVPKYSSIDFPTLTSIVFWNLNGVDGAGNIVEEVKNPQKTFPRSMYEHLND